MWKSYDVEWKIGSTTVYGTLVKPTGAGPFPGVVMAAGSGPTDRDWNSPLLPGTNGSAKLIAESLAEAGIASLRYDKRASGVHAAENMQVLFGKMSMDSHLEEFAGAVRALVEDSNIDPHRIFGLGNSEGTLHVLNYDLSSPTLMLAGLILTGAPGRSVGDVAHFQLASQASLIPNGDALLALYDEAVQRFLAGEPTAPAPELPDGVKDLLHSLESPANLPFARELWTTDGASLIEKVNKPILVVIGKKDIQVDWQADGKLLEKAVASKNDVEFFYPEEANHGLKHEPKARQELLAAEVMANYNAEGQVLDPQTMSTMVSWIKRHGA